MAEEYKNTNTEFTTPATHDETEVKDRGMFDFLKKEKKPEEEQQQVEAMTSELHQVKVSDDHPEKQPTYFHQDKEEEEKEKKPSLLEKFHRDDHSSSSSSDEEVEENGEKIRRKKDKKGLKEKIKEKFGGHDDHDTSVPIEKCDDELVKPPPPSYGSSVEPEEKKNFIEKIQEKLDHDELPGGAHHAAPQEPSAHVDQYSSNDQHEHAAAEEKKGFLEKIKEKFPGGHKKQAEGTEGVAAHHAPAGEYSSTEHTSSAADLHDAAEPKEKKGILEKIKEKLPGYHKTEDAAEHKEKEKEKVKEEGHY